MNEPKLRIRNKSEFKKRLKPLRDNRFRVFLSKEYLMLRVRKIYK